MSVHRSPIINFLASPALHDPAHDSEELDVPLGRTDPFMTQRVPEQHILVTTSPPSLATASIPSGSVLIREKELNGMRQLIDRLNAALAADLRKVPLRKSSAYDKLKDETDCDLTNLARFPPPLICYYDLKLATLEKLSEDLKTELQHVTSETVSVVTDNAHLRQQLSTLQGNTHEHQTAVDLLNKENELLTEHIKNNEEMLKDAFKEGSHAKLLESQLNSQKLLTSTQAETITTLSETIKSLERKMADAISNAANYKRATKDAIMKLETAHRDNRELKDENRYLCKEGAQLQKRGARTERVIDAYRGACEVAEIDADNDEQGLLEAKFRRLKMDSKELTRKHETAVARASSLEKDLIQATQKSTVEVHKKDAALRKAREHVEELVHMVENYQYESEQAKKQCERLAREVANAEEKLSRTSRDKQSELTDLVQRTNEQLRTVRRDFEMEKNAFQSEMDGLRKSKVDLQCEIGVLLRDKRAVEHQLNNVNHDIVIQRDKFRATLGI